MPDNSTTEISADDQKKGPLSRQKAAIVYADVANYSGLCAIDEDGTHRLLERYLEIFSGLIEQFGGRVHHYAGDAILATFELSNAAVNCSISVQKELAVLNDPIAAGRRIEFRIGINEGSVISGRGDVYGDDVNIAARLESLSTPGGICVSETVKRSVEQVSPDVTITYLGERHLKNLRIRVPAYLIELLSTSDHQPDRRRSRTGAWLKLPSQPSLAVLPFECLDQVPLAMRFADGLSMEVMTELVKLSGLFLASDFSTLRYRKEQPTPEAVSRELGVRYLLQGTVGLSGDRLRVYAQLIDAKSGNKIWAERYDDTLDDSFEIQDSITASIITALDVKLLSGERSRVTRKSMRNREALRHYYNGWSHLITGARENLIQAQREFEEAADLEPESPMPPAMASWTHWWQGFRSLAADSNNAFEKAEYFARRAQALEDPSGFATLVMAQVHLLHREYEQAFDSAAKAIQLRPSCDVSAATFASVLNYLDRPDEAIQYAEQAIRLTPIAPTIYPGILASSYYWAGRFEEAIAAAHAVIEHNPDALDAWLVLTAAESALDNRPAAQAAAAEVQNLKPDLELSSYLDSQPYVGKERVELLENRLRWAGLR
jgi:TolB-like protein